MSFAGLGPPAIAGFINFIRTIMGIGTDVLPDASPYIPLAFNVSMDIVNVDIASASSDMYALAVYNLGGSNLINWVQDASDAPIFKDDLPFWQFVRKKWNVLDPLTGLVESSGDNGSSQSLVVQEAAKQFTLDNIPNFKDPYGRAYLAIAQKAGPTIWGLTP